MYGIQGYTASNDNIALVDVDLATPESCSQKLVRLLICLEKDHLGQTSYCVRALTLVAIGLDCPTG
jgi:hypothetical protein